MATVSVSPLLEALGTAVELEGDPDTIEDAPPAPINEGNEDDVEGVPEAPEVGVPNVGNDEELVLSVAPDTPAEATPLRTTAISPPATAKNG